MHPDTTDWAALCLRLRSRYGWSQLKLARAVQSSRGSVAQWEGGGHVPGGKFAMALHELWIASAPRRIAESVAVGNIWTAELPPIGPGDLRSLAGPGVGFHYGPADITVRARTWAVCVEMLWLARLCRWRAALPLDAAEPFAAPESAPLA